MQVEVDRRLPILVRQNKDVLPERRSTALSTGIEKLTDLQAEEDRDLGKERRLVRLVGSICNCDGADRFSSPTFISQISVSLRTPILNPMYYRDGANYNGSVGLFGKFLFLGITQGDKEKPWLRKSDMDEWHLMFTFGKNELEYKSVYYAPVKGIARLSLNASAF